MTLSVHGDDGDFRVVLYIQCRLQIRQKYLSVHGEHAERINRIWRIRQECFAVYGEYADRHKIEPISANFRPKPKQFQILNLYSIHVRIGKKPSHATVP
jgi:hypothetical protein